MARAKRATQLKKTAEKKLEATDPTPIKHKRPAGVKWDHRKDKHMLMAILKLKNVQTPDFEQLSEAMGPEEYPPGSLRSRYRAIIQINEEVLADRQERSLERDAFAEDMLARLMSVIGMKRGSFAEEEDLHIPEETPAPEPPRAPKAMLARQARRSSNFTRPESRFSPSTVVSRDINSEQESDVETSFPEEEHSEPETHVSMPGPYNDRHMMTPSLSHSQSPKPHEIAMSKWLTEDHWDAQSQVPQHQPQHRRISGGKGPRARNSTGDARGIRPFNAVANQSPAPRPGPGSTRSNRKSTRGRAANDQEQPPRPKNPGYRGPPRRRT